MYCGKCEDFISSCSYSTCYPAPPPCDIFDHPLRHDFQIYKKVKPLMDALESAQEAKAAAIADLAKV